MKVVLALTLALLGVVAASSSNVLFQRTSVPESWTMHQRASGSEVISFDIALVQRNLDWLERTFWQVSDPTSKSYQQYLTPDEVLDQIAPSEQDHDTVVSWLLSHGVEFESIMSTRDSLHVKSTVSVAAQLFSCDFHHYKSVEGGHVVRSFGAMSVPTEVRSLIHMVTGISTFPIPHLSTNHTSVANDNQGVIAQTLFNLYEIPAQTAGSAPATSQGVIEFQGQCFSPADLTAYATNVDLPIQAVPATQIIGPNDPASPQTESTLDIDMIASVNLEATNWFWLEDGNGWLYTWATKFFAAAKVPQVVSVSYGWWEEDQCTIAPAECQSLGVNSIAFVERVNVEFQKIGLRGVSIVVASGDSGANGRTNGDCSNPQLRAAYPSSSPFVTSVGANELANPQFNLPSPPPICTGHGYQCASGGTEQAVSYSVSGFASGGGFSNIAATPAYQQAAVKSYLSGGVALPPASYFNATGRGAPDVSAIGHNTLIEQSGNVEAVGGTSAAAPIFAGVIALLNQAQVAKTGKPLGFLNPFLYQAASAHPAAFHDITVGDNKCTEQGCQPACQGFLAAKGWDPVTGLGSPNYNELLAYINSA